MYKRLFKYPDHETYESKRPIRKYGLALCENVGDIHYGEIPYDSRIQYLESTGTEYIDLNYHPRGNDIFEIKVRSTTISFYYNTQGSNYPLWNPFFGVQQSGTVKCYGTYVRSKSNNDYLLYYYNQISGNAVYVNYKPALTSQTVLNWFIYTFNKNAVTRTDMNGTTTNLTASGTNNGNDTQLPLSMWLFGVNDSTVSTGKTSKLQIEYFKVKDKNQNPIFNLVPVRIGTIGYMYDKISKQLFGNSGTGTFTLGPDIH
jgi:hypothetical protein